MALVAALAGTADARRRVTTPAEKLGKAFTAYEDGNLAGAASELKGVKPDQLANPDYFYWLRGQVLGSGGDAAAAEQPGGVGAHGVGQ